MQMRKLRMKEIEMKKKEILRNNRIVLGRKYEKDVI